MCIRDSLNPELIGGVTVRVPTYPEDGYHIRIQEYEKRVTSKTKMVLLTNPNNPTGTVYTRKELEELAAFCVEHDLICVCDQAFEDTVFPEHEMICICQLPGMWERTVTVCSVSKGMGLSGFRVGWTYATDTIMDTYYGAAVNIQGATSTPVSYTHLWRGCPRNFRRCRTPRRRPGLRNAGTALAEGRKPSWTLPRRSG